MYCALTGSSTLCTSAGVSGLSNETVDMEPSVEFESRVVERADAALEALKSCNDLLVDVRPIVHVLEDLRAYLHLVVVARSGDSSCYESSLRASLRSSAALLGGNYAGALAHELALLSDHVNWVDPAVRRAMARRIRFNKIFIAQGRTYMFADEWCVVAPYRLHPFLCLLLCDLTRRCAAGMRPS